MSPDDLSEALMLIDLGVHAARSRSFGLSRFLDSGSGLLLLEAELEKL
jgi:hypothetical protein